MGKGDDRVAAGVGRMTYMLAYHDISHHKSAIIFTPYPRLPRYWCSGQPRRLLRDRTPRLTSPRGSGRLSWEGIAVFEEPNRTIVGVKAPSSVVEIPTEPVASHVRAEPSVEPCWCQLRLSPRYPSELALAVRLSLPSLSKLSSSNDID